VRTRGGGGGHPDELLRDAVARVLARDVGRLPIVSREEPRRLVGYLGRARIMRARVRLYEEENLRERAGGARRAARRRHRGCITSAPRPVRGGATLV